MKPSDVLRSVGRSIAYYPNLTRLTGGLGETIFLCQFLYWTDKQDDPDGWIYKSQDAIEEETGMTRWEQSSARKNLTKKGLLEEVRRGVPAKLYYRINLEALDEQWEQAMMDGITRRERRSPTNKFVAKPQSEDVEMPQAGDATSRDAETPHTRNRERRNHVIGDATDIPIIDYSEITSGITQEKGTSPDFMKRAMPADEWVKRMKGKKRE